MEDPNLTREWSPKTLVVAFTAIVVGIAIAIVVLAGQLHHVEDAVSSLAEAGPPHKLGTGAIPDPTAANALWANNASSVRRNDGIGPGPDGQVLCVVGGVWTNCPPAQVTSPDQTFQFVNSASDVGGYFVFDDVSPGSAADLTAVANNSKVLIKAFATPLGEPNITVAPAGQWNFNGNAYVSATGSGTTIIVFDVYKRAAGGTETLIFSASTGNITALSSAPVATSFYQATDTALLATDRIVVKASCQTAALVNITCHFVFGTTTPSYVETPLTGTAMQTGGALSGPVSNATVNLASGATVVGALPTANQVNQSMAGDIDGSTGAAVVVAATGQGTDSLGSGKTVFIIHSAETSIEADGGRFHLNVEQQSTSDSTTMRDLFAFTVPNSSAAYIEIDCVVGDFANDGGVGFQGDQSTFSLAFTLSSTQPGGVIHVLTQNGMVYSTTVAALVPENPMTVLDGAALATTPVAAQVIIDASVARVQLVGPNTDAYHAKCSIARVQQTN